MDKVKEMEKLIMRLGGLEAELSAMRDSLRVSQEVQGPASEEVSEYIEQIKGTAPEVARPVLVAASNRGEEWVTFAGRVLEHVEQYTVPQYGDYPDDQMTHSSIEDIRHDMTRYANRMTSNARGQEEALRDMMKMAHYACIAYSKIKGDAV